MRNDLVLAEAVRAWATTELPGESRAADRAASIAQDAYEQGASVVEACGRARAFVGSWMRDEEARDAVVRLAL